MKLWHETYLQLFKLATAYYISKFSSTKKKEQYRKGLYSFVFDITQKILILDDFDISSGNRAVLKYTHKLGTAISIVLLLLFSIIIYNMIIVICNQGNHFESPFLMKNCFIL